MKLIKFILIVVLIFFLNLNLVYSDDKISLINLDLLLKQTNIGKVLLKDIEQLNEKNITQLKSKEIKLKSLENEIKKKQNIISEQEFARELDLLKENINKFQNLKDQMVSEMEKKKNLNLNEFFSKVNPIIQSYMKENSIDVVLDRKNVFMSKNSSDITEKLIIEINKKLN